MRSAGPVLVSACLLGFECRFDGGHCLDDPLANDPSAFYLPLCPELLGALTTPRLSAHITHGGGEEVLAGRAGVVDSHGKEVTGNFIKGAKETLRLARLAGATRAILKEKSPSCGVNIIKTNDGEISAMGVTGALLRQNGFFVEGR